MRTYKNSYTGKPTDPKNFYVDPEELADEIKKSQEQHQCTENLAIMCQKVLKNVINWPKFRYLDIDTKEELQSYAMYRWIKTGVYSCNAEGNVFSGFYPVSGLLHQFEKCVKGVGMLGQRFINSNAQLLPI